MRSCSSGQCHPPTTVHAGYAPRFPESAVGTIPCAALIIMSTSTRNTRPAHPSKQVNGGRDRLLACVPGIGYARRRKKATHREHHRLMHSLPPLKLPVPYPIALSRRVSRASIAATAMTIRLEQGQQVSSLDQRRRVRMTRGIPSSLPQRSRWDAGCALCHSRTANRWPRSTYRSPSRCARDVRGGLVSVVPFSAKV